MTKEVAEKIAKGITDKIECNTVDIDDWAEFWGFTREEYEEFLDMGIKAFEQQPCEDTINRNDLKRAISELTYWHPTIDERLEVGGAFDNTVYKVEDVWRLTKILPSVTPPQRKTGHWKWKLASNGWANHICSECGFKKNTDIHVKLNWQYCPNCGAKMEVEKC
jgi:hypothetical protein